jgi:hypothetical protein
MEREISHYADCVDFFQRVSLSIGVVHPYFLHTGGGPSAAGFRDMVEQLCAHNPVLALCGRLFCLREHGPGRCSVVPDKVSAGLREGMPCPGFLCCERDWKSLLWGFANMVQRELLDSKKEVDDLCKHGTRRDGHSAATEAWVRHTREAMERFAKDGARWAPDQAFGERLVHCALETSEKLAGFQATGFSTPPKPFSGAVPSGPRRVIGVRRGERAEGEPAPKARRVVNF